MSSADTPTSITPVVLELCRGLVSDGTPDYVSVNPCPGARPLYCYPNVENKVATDGGSIVYGWQIWECPGLYLEAEFHAVWESSSGEWVDITPKEKATPQILFLRDPVRKYEKKMIPNAYFALSDAPEVQKFFEACKAAAAFREKHTIDGEGMDLFNYMRYQSLEQRREKALSKLRSLPRPSVQRQRKIGRNDRCFCGSGQKYKKCHLLKEAEGA